MFSWVKEHKFKFAVAIFITIISPFILMGIVYSIDFLGGNLVGDVFHIIPVDKKVSASIYEYLYLYSQYLNVIVIGALTLGLFVFAFKDFVYKHLTETKIKLYVGTRIKIAINRHKTYFHIPLTFKNDSPKSGVIEDVKMILKVNNIEYHYVTENEIIVNVRRDNQDNIKYDTLDGEPFSCTPIEGEGVLRKTITFNMVNYTDINYHANEIYYLIFKFGVEEQWFQLSFSQFEIDNINRLKNENRAPESAGNFYKNIEKI